MMGLRGVRRIVGLVVVATLVAAVAGAQEPAPTAPEVPPQAETAEASSTPAPAPAAPEAAPLDESTLNDLGVRAEEVAARLRDMAESLTDASAFAAIETAVATGVHRVGSLWGETGKLVEAAPRQSALDSRRSAWLALRSDLEQLRRQIDALDDAREADLKALDGLRESWEQALDLARRSEAPAPVIARAEQTLAAIEATRATVAARRAQTLVLADATSRAVQGCDDATSRLEGASRDAVERTFVRRLPPLWTVDHLFTDSRTGVGHGVRLSEAARAGSESLVTYLESHQVGFVITGVLGVVLALLLRRARTRVERQSKIDPTLSPALPVLRAPHAAALILAFVLTSALRPHPPVALRNLLLLIAVPAVIALLRPLLNRHLLASLYALAALFVVELAREVLFVAAGLEQLLLTVEMGAAAVVLLRAASGMQAAPTELGFSSIWIVNGAAGVLRLLGVGAAVAALAALLGYVELADFLGGGSIFVGYLVFVAVGLRAAANALLTLALGAGPVAGLRSTQRHRALVERRVRWLLDVTIAAMWGWRALDRFALLAPARKLLQGILDARLQVGDLDIAVGHMLGFPVVLVSAYLLARVIVFVLEEDVYSRMALPRGVPYALSSLTRYGLLLVGFFLALGTLGFDLTRMTVLVSAFGLGIGFGLQQIVNNFVSGLILLFERPVQVGDAVQLGDMLGEVTRIGIRSSTVRTLVGAEVIVPELQPARGEGHQLDALGPQATGRPGRRRRLRDGRDAGARAADGARASKPEGGRRSRTRGDLRRLRRQLARLPAAGLDRRPGLDAAARASSPSSCSATCGRRGSRSPSPNATCTCAASTRRCRPASRPAPAGASATRTEVAQRHRHGVGEPTMRQVGCVEIDARGFIDAVVRPIQGVVPLRVARLRVGGAA